MAGLLTLVDIAMLSFAFVLLRKILAKKSLPLPPGPPRLPLLGNVMDMPSSQEWFTFAKWGEKWGDIVSVSVLGQQIIVLNSVKHAVEMLDKRSSIYSDRPVMQMGGELVGWKNTLVLIPYGDRFRNFRKLFHRAIGSQAAASEFQPVQEIESRRFLRRILANPEELAAHVRKTAGAVILRISHGYEVQEKDDPFVTLADLATEQFSLSTTPGGFLVNLIPALRHVPSWFPGAGFKRTAKEWARTLAVMAEGPHQFVKQQMAAGTAEISFTSRLLEASDISPEEEHDIKWSAASLYSGGADTTVSAVYALFLACVLYPEAARKAQQELDEIVGHDRLPSFADRQKLPYTNAFVLEVFRKMSHDPAVYSDPFTFKPERFLGPEPEQDPRDLCFGFGRRICPGRELAEASVFINSAMTLASFDITKSVVNGVVIEPKQEQTTGTISHLKPFVCTIKPRSQKAIDLIMSEEH
ncbi:hypothetical protein CVT26_010476 [Gymnopilus dilepis]|uniref:Cytochrome P450 n=1 Tax=Gymnopilus dilepis TaxID=231916 RepID=A0A409Y0E9_9AGAR|nr:hypothetical protein CVT26_010476 [Gymnopilus dilepis]